MTAEGYRFEFAEQIPLEEAEMTLQLALIAAEGLFGSARVRLDAGYRVDEARRVIAVDAGTEVGAAVVRVFVGFAMREFGESSIQIRRARRNPDPGSEGRVA